MSSVSFDRFGGINRSAPHGDGVFANDIMNFRVCKDGSLKKREGYRLLSTMEDNIRALHGGMINGNYTLFVLSGANIYTVDCETGEKNLVGSIETSEGKAFFFNYRGNIIVADGTCFFRYRDGELKKVMGYVPLFGVNWTNDLVGEVNEPRNILTKRARITYVVGDPKSIFMNTKYRAESVEAVYHNGKLLPPEKYYIDDSFTTIDVLGVATGDTVEIFFTYETKNEDICNKLYSITASALFGGNTNNRIFLCGGNDTGTVFCSKHVSSENLERNLLHFPDSDEFYFPEGYQFEAGDGINSVKNIVRHYDKLLIFTEGDVWMASPDSDGRDDFPATSVNAEIGCSAKNGAILVGNDTVSVGQGSVWLWTNDSDSPSKCKATKISGEVDSELRAFGLQDCSVFYDRNESELWLYSNNSDVVWIYNFEVAAWYKFCGFSADIIFDAYGKVGFSQGKQIFLFDSALAHDNYGDGDIKIQAYYQSAPIHFGDGKMINLSSATVSADLFGDPLGLVFQGRETKETKCVFTDGNSDERSLIKKRMSSGRFNTATFRIESDSNNRQKISRLTFTTR